MSSLDLIKDMVDRGISVTILKSKNGYSIELSKQMSMDEIADFGTEEYCNIENAISEAYNMTSGL